MNRRSFLSALKAVAITAIVVVLIVAGYFFRIAEYEAGVRPARYPGDPDAYRLRK